MPEGDTIFRAARTLHRALAGKPVVRFETALAQLSRVDDDAPIAGRTVERVRSVGKHLLVELSGDLVLRTHMRMAGSWHVYRPGERWQRPRSAMRVVLETADFQAVAFDVPVAEFRSGRALARDPALSTLGPDLLSDAFDVEAAVRRLRERGALGIGEALLDQRALAGIGNVYKNEVCFAGPSGALRKERCAGPSPAPLPVPVSGSIAAGGSPAGGAGRPSSAKSAGSRVGAPTSARSASRCPME